MQRQTGESQFLVFNIARFARYKPFGPHTFGWRQTADYGFTLCHTRYPLSTFAALRLECRRCMQRQTGERTNLPLLFLCVLGALVRESSYFNPDFP